MRCANILNVSYSCLHSGVTIKSSIELCWPSNLYWTRTPSTSVATECTNPDASTGLGGCALLADTPHPSMALVIGRTRIVVSSMLFFGTIVATITTYFTRPMQRPEKKIVDNLEQLNELTIDELNLLNETVDTLIEHVERLKKKSARQKAVK